MVVLVLSTHFRSPTACKNYAKPHPLNVHQCPVNIIIIRKRSP
jgi:hypothetical protein